MSYPKLTLKTGREASVLRRHPWIFSGAIERMDKKLRAGTIVEVFDSTGVYRATGMTGTESIAVKIVSFERRVIDDEFWRDRIGTALELRRELGLIKGESTTAFRLVNGEGDELPGLIVDLYDRVAVLQFHSPGMADQRAAVSSALRDLLPCLETIYVKGNDETSEFLLGENEDGLILENGLRFRVNWVTGQKTGFFLDQRESRTVLRAHSAGRAVLNTFAYTGGFSIAALAGGAAEVVSVESSKSALVQLGENLLLNGGAEKHESVCADCFEYLKDIRDRFDIIVLDPPAFAKHRNAIERAERGYRTINQLALKQVRSGGLVFTFSCSQLIDRLNFRRLVEEGASQSGRHVQVIGEFRQAGCHPVSLAHPEGEYLKGLLLRVGR